MVTAKKRRQTMNYKIYIEHENNPENNLEIASGNKKFKEPVTINITVEIEESKYETITDLDKKIIKIFK